MKFVCRQPGKKSIDIINRDSKVISHCVGREYSFVFKKAKMCCLWDVDGKKYLDFAAGIAVANVGHTNPAVTKAIKKQLKQGIHCGFADFYAELPVQFVEKLLSVVPKHLNQGFLSNSGTESVEAMYKLARWHTKKKYVIAFKQAFHGRTMGSLSMTNSQPVQRERFSPFLPVKHTPYAYCYRCPWKKTYGSCSFECVQALEKTIKSVKKDCAAVIMEPIQGEGGYIVPPIEFVQGVRRLCNKYNLLMGVDEVQSGCYRTGKFLAIEHFKVKPDIVSLSKAIGGGVPLGVTLANKKTMDWPAGSHANTFGGNLLACAAGIATLDYMKKKNLGDKATMLGHYIMKRLYEMKFKYPVIGDVRGKGLMIGVEFIKKNNLPAPELRHQILCDAESKGLILLPAGKSTIRICPPLIISKKQADYGLDILEDSIRSLQRKNI